MDVGVEPCSHRYWPDSGQMPQMVAILDYIVSTTDDMTLAAIRCTVLLHSM